LRKSTNHMQSMPF